MKNNIVFTPLSARGKHRWAVRLLPALLALALLLPACQAQPSGQAGGQAMDGCRVVNLLPTPNPAIEAVIPAVSAEDHILGSQDALVTIVEYSDFQCPYCALVAPALHELVKKYPKDVRLVYRFFPLSSHSNAKVSAYAAEAAGRQGKFFEYGEMLFANQAAWGGLSYRAAVEWFAGKAAEMQLDVNQFQQDLADPAAQKVVDQSLETATNAKVPGTPFLLINGQQYQGYGDLESLTAEVEYIRLGKRAHTSCPTWAIDPRKNYEATLKTSKGDIVLKLYAEKAPRAVNSFVTLAREGYYNQTAFYQVIPNQGARAGDPSASLRGGPGYEFGLENKEAFFNREGLVYMYSGQSGMNGSEFFITFAPAPNLNGTRSMFAEVLSGLDVAKSLTARNPLAVGNPIPPADQLISVEIREK